MCIPDAIHSSIVEGTVYFGSEKTPLPDVNVEIAGYAYESPVVASSTTDKNGRFSISGVKPGRYWLRAKHSAVGYFDVEFRLRSSLFWHQNSKLLIVIGADPSKGACYGGYAKAVRPH